MNNVKRTVTRVWLQSELNAQLKRLERQHPDCCGCRVKQIAPLEPGKPANWTAALFDSKCDGPCLDQVTETIGRMQQNCDVAW